MPESLQDFIKRIDKAAAEPLPRLVLAVGTAQDIEQVGDQLVNHYVEECRRSGLSWSQIGEKLGVTKQAAQQRFVP
ncbi:MAG: Clp protease N-terminal domain-containing protein, partial [Acidimicrobiia bacterium]